jgi:hypothetical protein
MAGYVEGVDRGQATLFPDRLDDFVDAGRKPDLTGSVLESRMLAQSRQATNSGAGQGRSPSALPVCGLPGQGHENFFLAYAARDFCLPVRCPPHGSSSLTYTGYPVVLPPS